MELKVNEVAIPEVIEFNYEELKAELTEKVRMYETLVYTEDQIKQAKADKANLNKLKKALNDERIRREREYMAPFNTFKNQINEIIGIIDKPVAVIDAQVKEFEAAKKEEKRTAIMQLMKGYEWPDWLDTRRIFDEHWLNASTPAQSISDAILNWSQKIHNDMSTLEILPEFSFEAQAVYKETLDLNRAISEAKRMSDIQEAKKAAEEAKKEEAPAPAPEPAKEEILKAEARPEPEEKFLLTFEAEMTIEQAKELRRFFVERGISFRKV